MRNVRLLCSLLLLAGSLFAAEHGVVIRPAQMYIAPDVTSAKLGSAERGREVVLLEKSTGYVHILVDYGEGKSVSGWVVDKGAIFSGTPNGDQVVYGEAVDSEHEAEKRHGRKGADVEAMRLYYELPEIFPGSALAAEAMYRAADIRWQIDAADVFSRRSAKEKDPDLRPQIETDWMKKVEKKYPNSKWADLAAYHYIDNKICGDWQGDPKCPEKETGLYEDYAKNHPNSPKLFEALMQAANRQAALVQIYKANEDAGKSASAKQRALEIAHRALAAAKPDSDQAPQAQRLIYLVEKDIPTYGSATE